jgi:hypothetical protein
MTANRLTSFLLMVIVFSPILTFSQTRYGMTISQTHNTLPGGRTFHSAKSLL